MTEVAGSGPDSDPLAGFLYVTRCQKLDTFTIPSGDVSGSPGIGPGSAAASSAALTLAGDVPGCVEM